MGRRLYGIQDLAEEIVKTCKKELKKDKSKSSNLENDITNIDKCFNKLITQYIENCKSGNLPENDPIQKLFNSKYGIYKTGQDKIKTAASLISKYCYYVSDYKFPIEDSLVRNNTNAILNYFNEAFNDYENIILPNRPKNLIKDLVKLCKGNNRDYDFDEFDHLVWAYGKIIKGSLSVFVEKRKYLEITERFKVLKTIVDKNAQNKQYKKNDQNKLIVPVETAEEIIREKLENKNTLKKLNEDKLISDNLYKFILFCFDCEKRAVDSAVKLVEEGGKSESSAQKTGAPLEKVVEKLKSKQPQSS